MRQKCIPNTNRTCSACGQLLTQRDVEVASAFNRRRTCGGHCRFRASADTKLGRRTDIACQQCGTEFSATSFFVDRGARYCSQDCASAAHVRLRTCQRCAKQYPSYGRGKKFCSEACQHAAIRRHIPCTCQMCGKQFGKKPSIVKKGKGRFCSASCRSTNAMQRKARAKPTWIEGAVYAALDELGVPYVSQKRIGPWVADAALLSGRIVIECQGDFYHANPARYPDRENLSATQIGNVEKDERKFHWYAENGYRLLALWESDIQQHGAKALLVAALELTDA